MSTRIAINIFKKRKISKCWLGCGETGILAHWWWEWKWFSCCGKVCFSLQVKHRITIWPTNPTPRNTAQRTKTGTQTNTHIYLFIAGLFMITKRGKQFKCPLNEWMDKHMMCVCVCMCVFSVAQSCPTLCDLVDCNPPDSSIHGSFLARILEWLAMSSSKGYSQPRHWPHVMSPATPALASRFFTTAPPG